MPTARAYLLLRRDKGSRETLPGQPPVTCSRLLCHHASWTSTNCLNLFVNGLDKSKRIGRRKQGISGLNDTLHCRLCRWWGIPPKQWLRSGINRTLSPREQDRSFSGGFKMYAKVRSLKLRYHALRRTPYQITVQLSG